MGLKKEASSFRAKIRMYRQGLGDCFLITLSQNTGQPFYMLIDCGVIVGTANAATLMNKVVDDISETTGGRLDVLVATHEHWDHLSGFVQAQAAFEALKIGEVWLAWTEDPSDELARKLRGERGQLLRALHIAEGRMRFAGAGQSAFELRQVLQLFGVRGATTADALAIVRKLGGDNLRYCSPANPPRQLGETAAKVHVLGPPHNAQQIKRISATFRERLYLSSIAPALHDEDRAQPFDRPFHIPLDAAKQLPYFHDHYWGEDPDSEEKDQSWRSIDGSWLSSSTDLAIRLDGATNNTSLVLAIELDGGDVLLFAADAQAGNWGSWQDLPKTPRLLERTVLYKVGHHGSGNGTPQTLGLEQMRHLRYALVPVDQVVAEKRGWDRMPLPGLMAQLSVMASEGVLRSDEKLAPKLRGSVTETKLYFEVTL